VVAKLMTVIYARLAGKAVPTEALSAPVLRT
jgi:hypothetical protein